MSRMKDITYPLSIDEATYQRIELESKLRQRSLADVFREVICLGLPQLPPPPQAALDGIVADTWSKLGPAPEVDYDQL